MNLPCFLLLLCTPLAPGQDSDALREHIKIVRDRRISLPGKITSMEALLDLGQEGARQLARVLGEELEDRERAFREAETTFLKRFRSAAITAGNRLENENSDQEVAELRKKILRNAIEENLTKEQVVAESDPALARLTELKHLTLRQVFAVTPELSDKFFELLKELEPRVRMYEYFDRSCDVLRASEDANRLLKQIPQVTSPTGLRERLAREQNKIMLNAIPMSDNDRRILRENMQLASEIGPQEAAGILELNLIRIRCGIGALRVDPKLCDAGRDHSKDMAELNFFSHTSPIEDKETFGQRASHFGTSAKSENIARGQETGKQAIDGWWYSPGHHRNMMAPASRIGIGNHELYWTQLFG